MWVTLIALLHPEHKILSAHALFDLECIVMLSHLECQRKNLKPWCCTRACSQGAWLTSFSRIALRRISRVHHACPDCSTAEPVPSCSHIAPLALCTQNASSKTHRPHWEPKYPRLGSLSGRATSVPAAEAKMVLQKNGKK